MLVMLIAIELSFINLLFIDDLQKVEFPSRKNNFSFTYARRQWDLLNDSDGLHNQLLSFDQVIYYVMISCTTEVDCLLFAV